MILLDLIIHRKVFLVLVPGSFIFCSAQINPTKRQVFKECFLHIFCTQIPIHPLMLTAIFMCENIHYYFLGQIKHSLAHTLK